jgi:hypothetical protein
MKHKSVLPLLFLFLLALTACGAGEESGPGPAVETPAVETSAQETASVADCPVAAAGAHQLIDAAHGICFLYPDNYDVSQGGEGGLTIYVKSPLNTEAPLASFSFEAAGGRSMDDITAQRLIDFALPENTIQAITLGGVPANIIDNLPGQDINRRVIAVHNDLVIDFMVARIGADYGPVGEQAEALYQMVTDSFQFIDVEAGAPLLAGPECPEVPAGRILFTNDQDGFCLLVPGEYAAQTGDGQTTFYVDSLMNVNKPRLFINVEAADGRTLDDVTTAIREEFAATMPGSEVMWSFGYMLDGVPANQFEQMPGQDLSRQLVMVHGGRFYTLTFVPDDPEAGDAYSEMQALYDLVIGSFSFLR